MKNWLCRLVGHAMCMNQGHFNPHNGWLDSLHCLRGCGNWDAEDPAAPRRWHKWIGRCRIGE